MVVVVVIEHGAKINVTGGKNGTEADKVTVKTEQKPVVSISKFKKHFKISGIIGGVSQKDSVSFSLLFSCQSRSLITKTTFESRSSLSLDPLHIKATTRCFRPIIALESAGRNRTQRRGSDKSKLDLHIPFRLLLTHGLYS